MSSLFEELDTRVLQLREQLCQLIDSPSLRFDKKLRSNLPEKQGIYRIFVENEPQATLRAGRTKSASNGLRQRVYQNHFQGDQLGNLRGQMVGNGRCKDLKAAKQYLKDHCLVQVLAIEDDEDRKWAEYFMLSVLRPIYSD
jgi:hypothetical protein